MLLVYKLQSIHQKKKKIKNKLHMKAVNYACFKLEEKVTRSVKKNKNNFIKVVGDKFTMSIR